MSDNFTRSEGLIKEVSIKGWLSSPGGQQGFEVVVLEKTGGGGTRFYRILKPGESLDLKQRLLSNYIALAIDVRLGRFFKIERAFPVYERGFNVYIEAKVRYRVTDVATAALNHVDPLGELRDKVTSTLIRELAKHREASVGPDTIQGLICSVGNIPQIGLMVDDAEIISFKSDAGVTKAIVDNKVLDHTLSVKEKQVRAELALKKLQADAERDIKAADQETDLDLTRKKISAINLTDINTLMQLYPDMIPQVFSTFTDRQKQLLGMRQGLVTQAVTAYIEGQKAVKGDVDPHQIAQIMRDFVGTDQSQPKSLTGGDIEWDEKSPSGSSNDDIIFGD
jgi:hypothetical protein